MSKNVLIVGAGPGFARANARRFGAEGYGVHLLGRNKARLESLRSSFEADGLIASTYVADVTDHGPLTHLIREIDSATPIDVCIFQPGGRNEDLVDVLDARVDNVRANLELLVLGAVAVGEALVGPMVSRRAGSLIFVGGGSARLPLRMFGNLGMAMAGLRAYALTLNSALADTGVHSAFFTVAGMIATDVVEGDLIDPAHLAERMWRLATERDAHEVLMTPQGEVVPKGAR